MAALRESQMEVADLRKQIEILTDRSKLEQTRIETRLQASIKTLLQHLLLLRLPAACRVRSRCAACALHPLFLCLACVCLPGLPRAAIQPAPARSTDRCDAAGQSRGAQPPPQAA